MGMANSAAISSSPCNRFSKLGALVGIGQQIRLRGFGRRQLPGEGRRDDFPIASKASSRVRSGRSSGDL